MPEYNLIKKETTIWYFVGSRKMRKFVTYLIKTNVDD